MSQSSYASFTPAMIDAARSELAHRAFSDTHPRDRRKQVGTAANKRGAAWTLIEYIEEGMARNTAKMQLQADGPSLGFSPNDIATGTYVALECLKLGRSRVRSAA